MSKVNIRSKTDDTNQNLCILAMERGVGLGTETQYQ